MGMLRDTGHETARAQLKAQITAAVKRLADLPPAWHPEHDGAYEAAHAEINALLDRLREMARP